MNLFFYYHMQRVHLRSVFGLAHVRAIPQMCLLSRQFAAADTYRMREQSRTVVPQKFYYPCHNFMILVRSYCGSKQDGVQLTMSYTLETKYQNRYTSYALFVRNVGVKWHSFFRKLKTLFS